MIQNKASLLLIYTGGTIGMKVDPASGTLRPFDFGALLDEVPEISKFDISTEFHAFEPPIDSSDVEPSMWQSLAELIKSRYEQFDGFVILHGTDTMAYSASALSFMLDGLTKPVVFTGSQLPIGAPRTDGRENLISAVEIASARDEEGHALVPEVSICFDSLLLRGNRATKTNADDFRAFSSPCCPPLAEAGISIRYFPQVIRRPLDWYQNLSVNTALDTRVSVLRVHPGITPEIVRYILCSPATRATILETYGAGNAPSAPWFTDIVSEAVASGKILVNVTQCLTGTVNMDLYSTGKALQDAGVVSGYDCTVESALAKLFILMGKSPDADWVKHMFVRNLKGEISR